MDDLLDLLRLGLQDCFGESGKPFELFRKYELDGAGIAAAVERQFERMPA